MHSIKNLSHQFGNKTIYKDINFDIEQGECVALLGESGCGKTTLLRSIAGLETPSSGEIHIDNNIVFSDRIVVKTAKRGVGLVFQEYALFPQLTVTENISFGMQDSNRLRYLLKLIDMEDHADRLPHQLSGGQQQRVAIARALAPRPKMLLLDEPFANIDSHRRMDLGTEIRRILSNEGTSALFVTHDQTDALSLSDRVAVMTMQSGHGHIAQCDIPSMTYMFPACPQVARLTGLGQFLEATANGSTAQSSIGEIPIYKEYIGKVTVLIRPENLNFNPGVGDAQVEFCACLGPTFLLTVSHQSKTITMNHSRSVAIGSKGSISFNKACWFWAET
jgi:iron(III) transport system ATP-binding protein